MTGEKVEIEYFDRNLDDVIQQYTDGFVTSPGTKIIGTEWFIDVIKKTIVFKIFTKTKG